LTSLKSLEVFSSRISIVTNCTSYCKKNIEISFYDHVVVQSSFNLHILLQMKKEKR